MPRVLVPVFTSKRSLPTIAVLRGTPLGRAVILHVEVATNHA
jgi:hypothetical protein